MGIIKAIGHCYCINYYRWILHVLIWYLKFLLCFPGHQNLKELMFLNRVWVGTAFGFLVFFFCLFTRHVLAHLLAKHSNCEPQTDTLLKQRERSLWARQGSVISRLLFYCDKGGEGFFISEAWWTDPICIFNFLATPPGPEVLSIFFSIYSTHNKPEK